MFSRFLWPPRYSIRTLAALLSAFCALLACWVATGTHGVDDVSMQVNLEDLAAFGTPGDQPLEAARRAQVWNVEARLPFLVGAMQWNSVYSRGRYLMADSGRQVYYVWCFGYVAKLPYSHRGPS